MKKITSKQIKTALYWYFRFERQWLCADEVYGWDMLVDTGRETIEVEIKVSKSDLWHGEAKKKKHDAGGNYANGVSRFCPNKFYVCVPTRLVEEARKWVEAVNPKYGVLEFYEESFLMVGVRKSALRLHDVYTDEREKLAMRLCAIIADMKKKELQNGMDVAGPEADQAENTAPALEI